MFRSDTSRSLLFDPPTLLFSSQLSNSNSGLYSSTFGLQLCSPTFRLLLRSLITSVSVPLTCVSTRIHSSPQSFTRLLTLKPVFKKTASCSDYHSSTLQNTELFFEERLVHVLEFQRYHRKVSGTPMHIQFSSLPFPWPGAPLTPNSSNRLSSAQLTTLPSVAQQVLPIKSRPSSCLLISPSVAFNPISLSQHDLPSFRWLGLNSPAGIAADLCSSSEPTVLRSVLLTLIPILLAGWKGGHYRRSILERPQPTVGSGSEARDLRDTARNSKSCEQASEISNVQDELI